MTLQVRDGYRRKVWETVVQRLAEQTQMIQGLASATASAFQSLTEKENYRSFKRLRLLAHLQESLSSLLCRLSRASRQVILVRLETMSRDPDLKGLRPGFVRLQEIVRNVLEKLKNP